MSDRPENPSQPPEQDPTGATAPIPGTQDTQPVPMTPATQDTQPVPMTPSAQDTQPVPTTGPVPPVEPDPYAVFGPYTQPAAYYTPPGQPEQSTQPAQPFGTVDGSYDTQFETLYGAPEDIGGPAAVIAEDNSTKAGLGGRRGQMVALLAAVALIAGLIGGGIGGLIVSHNDNANVSLPASLNQSGSSSNASVQLPEGSVSAVAAKVLPSVVSITETASDGSGGEGSGIVLSTNGLILTNNHVVVDSLNGGSLTVTFQSGQSVKATIVGRDPDTDLAVIRVQGVSGLVPATLGNSADLVVGQTVVAIGSPLGLSGTVTSGIVSALNRPVTTTTPTPSQNQSQNGFPSIPGFSSGSTSGTTAVFAAIQTDAAINPGNSGGALVDLSGHVIGINSAIASLGSSDLSGTQSGSIGVGFAIPIDLAKRISAQLIQSGKAVHPQLGVTGTDATGSGALIHSVNAGSAAAKAGLKAGDVVIKVDNIVVTGWNDLVAYIRSSAPGAKVTITYTRSGQTVTTTATLGQTSS